VAVVPPGLPRGEQVEGDMADMLSLSLWEPLAASDLPQSWQVVGQQFRSQLGLPAILAAKSAGSSLPPWRGGGGLCAAGWSRAPRC